VHRDVKPANVLVDEDGHAYLTDFGVTKQLGADSTDTGQIVGTLDYLAPEQIRGEGVSDCADEYALGGDESVPPPSPEPPARNGVAAIEGAGARLAFTGTDTPPSNVAVGEGGAWALSLHSRTVTRIDPETKTVVTRLRMPSVPSDIAVGAGAVWTVSEDALSRIDPRTAEITGPSSCRTRDTRATSRSRWGFPQIAVGAGAVWAINPDRTVSQDRPRERQARGDDRRRRRHDRGRRGGSVAHPRRRHVRGHPDRPDHQPREKVDPRGRAELSAVAVGGGYVGASAEENGLVWRIEPGRSPITRTIDVGVGVTFLAYDAGAICTANYNDGTVSRIDMRTNDVEATPVGAVQGLSAGGGSTWVSTAGATSADGLPRMCGSAALPRR
jgi:hypothetical protein